MENRSRENRELSGKMELVEGERMECGRRMSQRDPCRDKYKGIKFYISFPGGRICFSGLRSQSVTSGRL